MGFHSPRFAVFGATITTGECLYNVTNCHFLPQPIYVLLETLIGGGRGCFFYSREIIVAVFVHKVWKKSSRMTTAIQRAWRTKSYGWSWGRWLRKLECCGASTATATRGTPWRSWETHLGCERVTNGQQWTAVKEAQRGLAYALRNCCTLWHEQFVFFHFCPIQHSLSSCPKTWARIHSSTEWSSTYKYRSRMTTPCHRSLRFLRQKCPTNPHLVEVWDVFINFYECLQTWLLETDSSNPFLFLATFLS